MAKSRQKPPSPPAIDDPPDGPPGSPLSFDQRIAIARHVAGESDTAIQHALGWGPNRISRWRCADDGVYAAAEREAEDAEVARVVENARRRLKRATPRAVETMLDVMDGTIEDEDGNVKHKAEPQHRLAAAKAVLDRSGVGEIKGLELTGANGGPVRTVLVDELAAASDEALRQLAAGATLTGKPS